MSFVAVAAGAGAFSLDYFLHLAGITLLKTTAIFPAFPTGPNT